MKLFRFIVFICILCLSTTVYADKDDINDRRETFIKDFISYYQAAYQKEEISYIAQFFSSDALIVTETKQLIPMGSEIIPRSTKSRDYHSIIENRNEYIARLKECFENNEKISIGISNVLIRRHPKYNDIYGVNFFQIWDDSGGFNILENKMSGYIFMMVDFRNSEMEPIIHVRTWQPKSNIEKPSDKYTLTDFRIISTE